MIYDRVCLSSKVNLKEFRSQQIQLQSLETSVQQLTKKVEKLEKGINSLTQVCLENQLLTREEVTTLVSKIAQQSPKVAEEQALKIKQDLQSQLKPIEELLQHIKGSLIG